MTSAFRCLLLLTLLATGPARAGSVPLPNEAMTALGEDMQRTGQAMEQLAGAIARGDWEAIGTLAPALAYRDPATRDGPLPMQWRQLDGDFRARIEKLKAAAGARDPVLVIYQFSRLLEGCTSCHSAFADERFPGFSGTGHQH